ncbi:MAG: hypothetical protein PVH19_01570 [Planctomycetia bacterium]|jgi:hypothetical protein
MNAPAIVLGDVNTILQLPPAEMQNPKKWGQLDSDIIAHYLQVQGQIQRSNWNKSDITFTVQGDNLLNASFPEFADFVFVAVYFRQLTMQKDDLLNDAAKRYRTFVACPIRNAWIYEEQKRFSEELDDKAFMLPIYTVRELFDAFMYGASLMHKAPRIKSDHRARFLEIYDKEPRHKVLYALNMSMKTMMNHVYNIAAVLYRDVVKWTHDHSLPLPDIRWHDRLFDIKRSAQQATDSEKIKIAK